MLSRLTQLFQNPLQLLYTLPGIPSIYYGSEFGVEGKKEGGNDDPLRPKLQLDELKENPPFTGLVEQIQKLSKIRKEHHACTDGAYRELLLTNRQYAFARICEDDMVIAAVNNDEAEANVSIPVPDGGRTWTEADTGCAVTLADGRIQAVIPAHGAMLFSAE